MNQINEIINDFNEDEDSKIIIKTIEGRYIVNTNEDISFIEPSTLKINKKESTILIFLNHIVSIELKKQNQKSRFL